jgi:hypothetical protein
MAEKSNLFSNTQLRSFLEKVINNYMVNIEMHKIAPIIKISNTVTQQDFCKMFENIIIPYFKLLVQQLKNDKSDSYSEYFKLYNYYINLYKLLKLILNNTSNKTLQIKYNKIWLASTDVYFEYLWFDCVLNSLTKHFNIKFTKIVYKIYNADSTLFNNIKEYVAHIEYMEQYNFITHGVPPDGVYYNERIASPYIKIIENYYESFTQKNILIK